MLPLVWCILIIVISCHLLFVVCCDMCNYCHFMSFVVVCCDMCNFRGLAIVKSGESEQAAMQCACIGVLMKSRP